MAKKQKKEKVIYVDDGRTIADMSNVSSSGLHKRVPGRPRASFKDQWSTYWGAVKMMLVPMLVIVCALIIMYMIMSLIFWLA